MENNQFKTFSGPGQVQGREIARESTFSHRNNQRYPIRKLVPEKKRRDSVKRHSKHAESISKPVDSLGKNGEPGTKKNKKRSYSETPKKNREGSSPDGKINHIVQQSLKKQKERKEREAQSLEREKEEKERKSQAFNSFNKNTRIDNFTKFKHEKFLPRTNWSIKKKDISNQENNKAVKAVNKKYKKEQRIIRKNKNSPESKRQDMGNTMHCVSILQRWIRGQLAKEYLENCRRQKIILVYSNESDSSIKKPSKEPKFDIFKRSVDQQVENKDLRTLDVFHIHSQAEVVPQKSENKDEPFSLKLKSDMEHRLNEWNNQEKEYLNLLLSPIKSTFVQQRIKSMLQKRFNLICLILEGDLDRVHEILYNERSESEEVEATEFNVLPLSPYSPITADLEPTIPSFFVSSEKFYDSSSLEDVLPSGSEDILDLNSFQIPNIFHRSIDFPIDYLDLVLKITLTDKSKLERALLTPVSRDPLEVLSKLQCSKVENISNFQFLNEFVIDFNTYLLIEQKLSGNTYEKIETRMIFEAINESFSLKRVYGRKGKPFPWIKSTRSCKKTVDIEEMIGRVKEDMIEWSYMQAGQLRIQDCPDEELEKELIQQAREEKVANMLALEVIDFDYLWTDYDIEETQLQLSLGDNILDTLIDEIIHINNIQ